MANQKETENSIYVVSFELKIEKWQSDILDKRFAILTNVYKNLQRKFLRKFHYISQTKKYIEASKTKKGIRDFFSNYEEPWIKLKKGEKTVNTYKPFTEYGFITYSSKFLSNVSDSGINSKILSCIAQNAWRSWNKFFYGNGKKINFRNKEINSYKTSPVGKTFIGIDSSKILSDNIIGVKINNKNGKKSKLIYIPFIVNKKSIYETICFQDEIREIGFKRVFIRGKYKYYVFFSFKGKPYNKNRKIGDGKVGIDLGPSTIAVASNSKVYIDELAKGIDSLSKETKVLQRKLDRSRRANNPLQFNEDGTIKKYKKGERPKWIKSKNYIKTQNKLKEISRKLSNKRKLKHIALANQLLELGSSFQVENNPISSWAKKAKKTTINKKGKINRKKRFGKSISNHAPSLFIEILKNKVLSLGGSFNKIEISNGASQFDFTNGTFTKHSLSTRRIKLSNGNIHLRDTIAAFNIMHCIGKTKEKELAYDIDEMINDYGNFIALESSEIERHKNSDTKILKSIGITK